MTCFTLCGGPQAEAVQPIKADEATVTSTESLQQTAPEQATPTADTSSVDESGRSRASRRSHGSRRSRVSGIECVLELKDKSDFPADSSASASGALQDAPIFEILQSAHATLSKSEEPTVDTVSSFFTGSSSAIVLQAQVRAMLVREELKVFMKQREARRAAEAIVAEASAEETEEELPVPDEVSVQIDTSDCVSVHSQLSSQSSDTSFEVRLKAPKETFKQAKEDDEIIVCEEESIEVVTLEAEIDDEVVEENESKIEKAKKTMTIVGLKGKKTMSRVGSKGKKMSRKMSKKMKTYMKERRERNMLEKIAEE